MLLSPPSRCILATRRGGMNWCGLEGPRVRPRAPRYSRVRRACASVRQRAPASQAYTKVSEPVTADLRAARSRR